MYFLCGDDVNVRCFLYPASVSEKPTPDFVFAFIRTSYKIFYNRFRVIRGQSVEFFAPIHCFTIIKAIQKIKSRIKEIKEDEYPRGLLKIQVCAMFRAGDIQRNVLLNFIRPCMETPCLRPSVRGHKCGGRKLTKTYVIEFAIKKSVVVF